MTTEEFLQLAKLLLKWRSSFAMYHRFRDVIDKIVLDCLYHL